MTSDLRSLAIILVVFWGAWWLIAVVAKRSYIPVIPLVPLALGAVGYLLNMLHPWVGTVAIAALHLVLIAKMIRDALRRPNADNGGRGANGSGAIHP